MDNKELNEKDLNKVIGSSLSSDKISNKFKEIKNKSQEKKMEGDELDFDQLDKVYGGPIKTEDLPEEYKIGR